MSERIDARSYSKNVRSLCKFFMVFLYWVYYCINQSLSLLYKNCLLEISKL
ncbi:uncharacterized protein DS421_6g188530 [Arachis hypogaea]|nr:uncharacterized protein DS421_6g188530 [Arachis hypogaea]